MRRQTSLLTAALAGAALALPAAASADVMEIGKADPPATASCPTRPCLAVSRTTGYQAKVGSNRGLMTIPADGRIVAWTIGLGKPGKKQTAFFDSKLGGAASAQITVLNPRRKLRSRAVGQGELQKLAPYFGSTVQFPLKTTIPVKKGWVLALTVPTWAPALTPLMTDHSAWRASRPAKKCSDTATQTAQTNRLDLARYECLYKARLTYSATLITNPAPAKPASGQR